MLNILHRAFHRQSTPSRVNIPLPIRSQSRPLGPRVEVRTSATPYVTQAVYIDPRQHESVICQFDHTNRSPRLPIHEALITFLSAHTTATIQGQAFHEELALSDFQQCAEMGAIHCTPRVFVDKVLRGENVG